MSLTIHKKFFETEIDRNKFGEICSDIILRLRHPVERALRDADISPKKIDAIILIGGSTRMPLVKSVVSKMFNKLPYSNINPDEAVALGAGIQAALKERNSDLKELVLTDVCPYTLGVEIVNNLGKNNYESGYFLPIIERNSPIPLSKVENIVTIRNNQTKMLIKVYQGESRRVENNIKLGEFEVSVPCGKVGEQMVALRYTYDINGLLEVEATLLSTAEKKSIIIQNSENLMSEKEIKKRMLELKDIKIHPRDKIENRLLLAKGERLYEESLGEKRQYIAALLNKFERILLTQDPRLIEKNVKLFAKKLDELEEYY